VLLFVIDMAGSEGRDPRDDFAQLRKEVSLYQKEMARGPTTSSPTRWICPSGGEFEEIRAQVRRKAIPIAG